MGTRWTSSRLVVVTAVAAVVVLALGGAAVANHDFDDVGAGSPFHEHVSWALENGITAGCGGNSYCPNNPVTRGQMAAFLANLASTPREGTTTCGLGDLRPIGPADSWQFTGDSPDDGAAIQPLDLETVIYCDMKFPDGATITSFTATMIDTDATEVAGCLLAAVDYTAANAGDISPLFSVQTSGSPGTVRLVDDGVSVPVDNSTFTYVAACQGSGDVLAFYALAATYSYLGVAPPLD